MKIALQFLADEKTAFHSVSQSKISGDEWYVRPVRTKIENCNNNNRFISIYTNCQ